MSEWIKFSDKRPPADTPVLTGKFYNNEWFYEVDILCHSNGLIPYYAVEYDFWMPLPAAPEVSNA